MRLGNLSTKFLGAETLVFAPLPQDTFKIESVTALHNSKRFILKILASHVFLNAWGIHHCKEPVFTWLSACLSVGRYLRALSVWKITLHA